MFRKAAKSFKAALNGQGNVTPTPATSATLTHLNSLFHTKESNFQQNRKQDLTSAVHMAQKEITTNQFSPLLASGVLLKSNTFSDDQ
jgi:hypothetical protein